MFKDLNLEVVSSALADDVSADTATIDSPTTVPCGITVSITLGCG